jgi:hypothetical protein
MRDPSLVAHNGWPPVWSAFRLRHRGKARRISAGQLGELHKGGEAGVVVHQGSQDALELLVAECGALLVEHVHIDGCRMS